MILKTLNEKLGPKTFTSEGNTQEIGKLVKDLTGKDFVEIKKERAVRIRSKRDPIVPQRMSIKDTQSTFHSNAYMLRKQEQQTGYFDTALSKLHSDEIAKKMDEHKLSQKVYKPYTFERTEKNPPTRLERNMMMFKKIFIDPELQRIEGLKSKEQEFTNLVHNVINDQYDKLLEVQFKKIHPNAKAERPKTAVSNLTQSKRPMSTFSKNFSANETGDIRKTMRLLSAKPTTQLRPQSAAATAPKKRKVQSAAPNATDNPYLSKPPRPISKYRNEYESEFEKVIEESYYEENPELDDDNGTEDGTAGSKNDATNFFEQPIFLQLPEMPNSTIASSLSPGFGWAPSLPHLTSLKFSREEISNMMLRAKCGIKSGDVQKLAHMFFYMGIVYENKKNYKKATAFFKNFYNVAKRLEDKVGMGFALNRISCGQYYQGQHKEAIASNEKCMEFMDEENVYVTLYNAGVFYRKVGRWGYSREFLEKAVGWARDRGDEESECISLGQLGLTFQLSGDTQNALICFDECKQKSSESENPRLALDALLHSLKIRETSAKRQFQSTPPPNVEEYTEALHAAKALGDTQTADRCKISMAVVKGENDFNQFRKQMASMLPTNGNYGQN